VPRFRVVIRDTATRSDRVAATVDSLDEALSFAHALAEHGSRVEWERSPGAPDGSASWGRLDFSPTERAELERTYLLTRAELQAAGVSSEKIDSMLPLTPDGRVPWE